MSKDLDFTFDFEQTLLLRSGVMQVVFINDCKFCEMWQWTTNVFQCNVFIFENKKQTGNEIIITN